MYHLVALRYTLTNLLLTNNVAISDGSVSALVLFDKLTYIALAGTSITVMGLRELASAAGAREQALSADIPHECKQYIISKLPASIVLR